jgi:PAS domain S-box-containing protein
MTKILVIDDNGDNLVTISAILRDSFPEATIFTAESGPDGINITLKEDPDVILLDVVMPDMDGFEVCRQLKEIKKLKDIPVVFLTALKESKENKIKALEAGGEGFLTKPIDEAELIAQIRAMIKISMANKEKENENERLNVLVKERTNKLSESEQRWSTTLECISDGVIATDLSGLVTFMNSEAEGITGFQKEECLKMPLADFFITLEEKSGRKEKDPVSQILGNHSPNKVISTILINKEGRRIPIEHSASIVQHADGKRAGVVLIFRDISERKLAEDLLKNHGIYLEQEIKKRTKELERAKLQAESADRFKSAFLANMSNEIRTPLNSIIGFSGVLLKGFPGPLNEEQKKQIGFILSSGKHLLSLINDILDLSKIEAGQMQINYEIFDIYELLDEIVMLQRPAALDKGLVLNLDCQFHSFQLKSDRQRLKQVIINLVNNAIKFTDQGTVNITCRKMDDYILMSVRDTGIGISKEEIKKLFHPFVQIENNSIKKNEGTGLGLSICKKLVELLKGGISVESEIGKGSEFKIELPIYSQDGLN